MAEVIVIPAFTRQLVASVTLFGRKMPTIFIHPIFMRFLASFGGDIEYALDAPTRRWLNVAATMYARAFSENNASMRLGLFEPIDILLVGQGNVDRSAGVVSLMRQYLMRRLIPPEAIFSRTSSRQLQGNLHKFIGKIRRYSGSERILKIIFVGNDSVTNKLNRRTRRIVPLARFERTGFFQENGIKVFFLSCPVVEPESASWFVRGVRFFLHLLSNFAVALVARRSHSYTSYAEERSSYIGVPELPDAPHLIPIRRDVRKR